MKIGDFEIIVSSDTDYEDLIAEILYRGEFCALLTQDEGIDKPRIELHPRCTGQPWSFDLGEWENVIDEAKRKLRGLRRAASP